MNIDKFNKSNTTFKKVNSSYGKEAYYLDILGRPIEDEDDYHCYRYFSESQGGCYESE